MLVFCCGMMRSGSTLQYQLAAEIVELAGVGRRMGWIDSKCIHQIQNRHNRDECFIIAKCHNYFKEVGDIFSRGEAKAIYVYRDLRDVIVSLMNKFDQSFWQIVKEGYIETILKAFYDWTRFENILVSRYEIMIIDLSREVAKIADYLGVVLDDSVTRQLTEKYSIDQQIKRIQSFDYEHSGTRLRTGDMLDPATLLHANHIFSGSSGQWESALTKIQICLIEDKAYQWLVEVGYPISQPWIFRKAVGTGFMLYFHFMRVLRFVGRRIQKLTKKNPQLTC